MDLDIPRCLSKGIGELLKALHDKGFIHSSFSIRCMLSFTSSTNAAESLRWKLTKLNSLTSVQHASTYQRMMNLDGSHVFDSIVFPPEIFTKLDDNELAAYEQYWKAIFLLDNHDISPDLVRSRINPLNGNTYAM